MTAADLEKLTPRQLAIFERIGHGLQWKRIAGLLGITEGTVKSQAYLIYRKLGIQSRVEVIRYCAARDAAGGCPAKLAGAPNAAGR